MAVENDYNLLVANLNHLAEMTEHLRGEVQHRLIREKREKLEANETHWVNMMFQHLTIISGLASSLNAGAQEVLQSMPGIAVLPEQPPTPDLIP